MPHLLVAQLHKLGFDALDDFRLQLPDDVFVSCGHALGNVDLEGLLPKDVAILRSLFAPLQTSRSQALTQRSCLLADRHALIQMQSSQLRELTSYALHLDLPATTSPWCASVLQARLYSPDYGCLESETAMPLSPLLYSEVHFYLEWMEFVATSSGITTHRAVDRANLPECIVGRCVGPRNMLRLQLWTKLLH